MAKPDATAAIPPFLSLRAKRSVARQSHPLLVISNRSVRNLLFSFSVIPDYDCDEQEQSVTAG
jgi:hypothetical protein